MARQKPMHEKLHEAFSSMDAIKYTLTAIRADASYMDRAQEPGSIYERLKNLEMDAEWLWHQLKSLDVDAEKARAKRTGEAK